jgi:hypothetical protein
MHALFQRHVPAVVALRAKPTAQDIHDAIQWADQQGFINVGTHLRTRDLSQ